MLAAFLDESGKHGQSTLLTLAGFRASEQTWTRFRKAWKAALAEHGLECFHAADCESGYGEFKGFGREARDAIQRQLITVINKFNLVAYSLSISRQIHARAVELAPSQKYRSSPYYFLFHGAFSSLADHPHGLMKRNRVAFFFDRQKEYSGLCREMYAFAQNTNWSFADRLGPLVFADKRSPEGIPIQAADFLAYESYKAFSQTLLKRHVRWQMKLFIEQRERLPKAMTYIQEFDERYLALLQGALKEA